MASDQFRKWLSNSSDSELEERYSAGPTNDEAQLIAFELDRRKLQRQSKVSSAAMWAGVAAAVAAVISLTVILFQATVPAANELAEREQVRREAESLYADCTRKSSDLIDDIVAYQSSFKNEEMSNDVRETVAKLFETVKEINGEALMGIARLKIVSRDVRDSSEFDYELHRSRALRCIGAVAGWATILDFVRSGRSVSI